MAKKNKKEGSLEEQLELNGSESANQLYTIYIKHYTSNSKLTDKARQVWKKKYKLEKGR